MGISTRITCDDCGTERGQTNHWFKITMTAIKGAPRRLLITDFPANQKIQRYGTKLACGHDCLHKIVSRLLG